MWQVVIFETRTGAPILDVTSLVGSASWSTRRNGQGTGSHSLRLTGAGIPRSVVEEITRGNKYTIAQIWSDGTVAYAGVLVDEDWDEVAQTSELQSKEIRAFVVPGRMLFGVLDYAPDGIALTIANRSYSSAVRRLFQAAMAPSSEWVLPIPVTGLADTVGGFSATWRKEEQLTWENCLKQIEDDGCEVMLRPYLSGGSLFWEPIVAVTVTIGSPWDLAVRAPGSLLTEPKVKFSSERSVTGILGFGKGTGQQTPFAYAPTSGSGATDQPIRDTVVTFADIEDQTRLQAAVDAEYNSRRDRAEKWSYGVHIWPDGPARSMPGRVHRLWTYGSARLPDGFRDRRVIALSGDMSFKVTPEVQNAD